jgi:hypothetical protein
MMREANSSSESLPSTEQILGQLDAEVEARTAEVSSHGWTASNVLLALVSVLGLLITQIGAHWTGPVGVLHRWVALFLLFSLFFDTLISYSPPPFRRFYSDDIRGRLQWTDLIPQDISGFDLVRYLFLLTLLTYFRFPVEWYVQLMACIFYGTLLITGLLTFLFKAISVLVPIEQLQQFKQKGSLLLCAAGFISGWQFLKVILDNPADFRSTDLLVAGALVSTCYLVRRLSTPPGSHQIIKALREIRRDLALADIDMGTAKRRYVAVTSGMTLAEAIADYTRPVSLLLHKAVEEMSTAQKILASLRKSIENIQPQASREYDQQLGQQWAAQRGHYDGALLMLGVLSKLGRARRYRLLDWLMRFYRKRYFPWLSGKSRAEVEMVLTGIEEQYQNYQQAEREYLAERAHVVAAAAKHPEVCPIETEVARTIPVTFDLPAWLQLTRTALLGSSLKQIP